MKRGSEKLTCERCKKHFDELITREGFCQTYFVEWVCEDCYAKLEPKLLKKLSNACISDRE